MTTPRSRRALAAGAAGFAAIGATGAYVVMNALSGPAVVNFTPAAATDDVQSTVSSLLGGATTATTAASNDDGSGATTTTTPKSPSGPATADDKANCDHDGDHQPLDDATAAKVKAAAEKAVPGATVEHTDHDRSNPDGYVAMMEKADGTHVLVHEDANFTVTKVEDPAPPRGPGGHRHGDRDRDGDHSGTTPTTAAAS